MRALYEIDSDIMDCFDEETGELLDEEKLNELQIERDQKIEGVGLAVKNLTAEIDAYKKEIDAFQQRKRSAEKRLDGFKKWLLETLEGEKFATPKVDIRFRRSETVDIPDESVVPDEYIVWKTESKPDKVAIKQAIKAGSSIEGCQLIQKLNISIK